MHCSNTTDRLIQTAAILVYQQGFHHTTLADSAQQVQVPLGTVYSFFKTKEAIGETVVKYYLHDYRERCQQWDNDPLFLRQSRKRFLRAGRRRASGHL